MSKPRAKLPFSEETLQAMLVRVLRPLVKLALASGFNFTAFSVVLRRLYIEVAEKEFALPNKQQTDSRISLLTGIHRKDVNRLRGLALDPSFLTVGVSQTSRILARWLADPLYCDAEDRPSTLPRTSSDGVPSFESLVSDITKDVHPRSILDDWLDKGIVVVDDNGWVRLNLSSIVPNAGDEARRHYFTRNLRDHVQASVMNLMNDPPPYFERAVHYDGMSPALAARLDEIAREEGMAMLLKLNKIAHQAIKDDPGGSSRWISGLYVMTEEREPDPQADAASETEADE
ncbi:MULTISPECIES: DUF6502 family protein [unclassified Rhizobium]|uniref:DUF6502 family protein n=1 Tax=unclassified Rhizobium TaxID=2613769 RepID=UPI001A97E74B|nr:MULTISPECIES: DUF6502 family protein [unclassified Rhizobium]MBX5156728.1 hypothetical protein [Rhizobium sp. NZLR8]MBX5162854.1 hypothetical protein [Rhizobium sp. NZLR4b]MBX5181944.1 hypothetical protein [Rhizobium sp. NZLR5]MBX5187713.1 hypothetical protein [Rhizobium sp. NZLR3b]MBX5194093.1 hypothetical protein [Rhizobium sp. NZLR10]